MQALLFFSMTGKTRKFRPTYHDNSFISPMGSGSGDHSGRGQTELDG